MYPCPGCGADLRFDVETKTLSCRYCGKSYSIEEILKMNSAKENVKLENTLEGSIFDAIEMKVYSCSQCGGELLTDENTVATFCSYCGSTAMVAQRIQHLDRPEYIIPFGVKQEEAFANYKKKLLANPFLPSAYRKQVKLEKLRGIYMPYDVIKYEKEGLFHAYGETSKRRGDYVYYYKHDVNSELDFRYEICGHDTSSRFDDVLSESIAPFNINEAIPFDEKYLPGYYADAPDVKGTIYKNEYSDYLGPELGYKLNKTSKLYKQYKCDMDKAAIDLLDDANYVGSKSFFPVWFISCRHSKNKISYGVINGNTGEATAELPISFGKYIVGSLILSALIFCLLTFVFNPLIRHKAMLFLCMALAIVSMVISIKVSSKVYLRKTHLDDKGYFKTLSNYNIKRKRTSYKSNRASLLEAGLIVLFWIFAPIAFIFFFMALYENADIGYFAVTAVIAAVVYGLYEAVKAIRNYLRVDVNFGQSLSVPFTQVLPSIAFQLFSIAISFIFIAQDSFNDNLYYTFAIVTFISIMISFFEIVTNYNKLTCRPLPQLEPRGGDE